MNPNNAKHLRRFRTAMNSARKRLEPFRKRHRQLTEQYVGTEYSANGARLPVPINMIELATNIYERQLIARPPAVLVTTRSEQHRPAGVKFEKVINDKLRQLRVHDALRSAVKSSMYSMGIVKVGAHVIDQYEYKDYVFEKTEPFVQPVLIDDWVHDMRALRLQDVAYCGNRFRMGLEDAQSNPEFISTRRQKLQSMQRRVHNEDGRSRISTITQGESDWEEEYEEQVELWEIFLPKEQLLVTLSEDEDAPPLKVVDWEGPERGPFHMLWFNEVDGNSMPLAPGMLWQGLHETINALYRKIEREAARSKNVGLVRSQNTEDAERIRMLSDGEIGVVDNPDAVMEKNFGGIDQRSFAFMLQSKDLFSWLSGNLDALGGLGPQAGTLGQDRLLFASANQRIAGMQDRVMEFTRDVIRDMSYWLWEEPLESYPLTLEFPEMEPIEAELTPEERDGHEVFEHEMEIEPYSMQHMSPGERLQNINQIVTGIIMPSMPLLNEQGLAIDMGKLMEMYARYSNLPELNELIITKEELMTGLQGGEKEQQGGGGNGQGRQSPVTHRTNERISSPGPSSRANADMSMISELMAANPGRSEGMAASAANRG